MAHSIFVTNDYVVFVSFILGTVMIPLYTKLTASKDGTKAGYVFAKDCKISMTVMLMSLARGTLGVRSILGFPSELYYNGTRMFETLYGFLLAYPITSYLFVPVYYSLGVTSIYQYLDLRFKSTWVRSIASGFYIIRNVFNTGVTVFTPCVALKTIMRLPYWSSIIGILVISIICAFMGGLKAVILGDMVQGLASIACILGILLRGTYTAGGISNIIKVNSDRGRFIFFNFDMDPEIRVSTVSAFLGQLFMSVSIYGCQQNFVQRYASMESVKSVQRTLWLSIPVIIVLNVMFWYAGAVIFANYADCDPYLLGVTSKIDEIVPFYVGNEFWHVPGFCGLFMATVFNGSLSLTVSNLNSMATVAWEDFLSKLSYFKAYKDREQLLAIKALVVILGLLILGVAFGMPYLPGVIEGSQLLTSATSGPLLGVFILALFFPSANSKGAAFGMVFSMLMTLTLMFGRLILNISTNSILSLSVEGCTNTSFSVVDLDQELLDSRIHWTNSSASAYYFAHHEKHEVEKTILSRIFNITYMYYAVIGTTICVISGLIVSCATGTSEKDLYDRKLLHPLALKISNMFPGKRRQFLGDLSGSSVTDNAQFNDDASNYYEDSIVYQASSKECLKKT